MYSSIFCNEYLCRHKVINIWYKLSIYGYLLRTRIKTFYNRHLLSPTYMKIRNINEINWLEIKNILFDLGGVILNIDHDATVNEFVNIGIPNFSSYFTHSVQNQLFRKYEKGLVSSAEMREQLKKDAIREITDSQIDYAWCALLKDTPNENLNLLKTLKSKYRVYLLSNTNEVHIDNYLQKVKTENGVDFQDFFHKVFYSYKIGMRKPDAEIFEYVLKDTNVKAEETLYIDDTEVHINTAAELGFQSFLLQNPITIHNIFNKIEN